MSDGAIRKALEVAAKALCFGHDGQDCDMCAAPEHCYKSHVFLRKDAAAAIAAFHEDMAANSTGLKRTHHKEIAAAIERAAGGEGEWKVTMTEVKKENN